MYLAAPPFECCRASPRALCWLWWCLCGVYIVGASWVFAWPLLPQSIARIVAAKTRSQKLYSDRRAISCARRSSARSLVVCYLCVLFCLHTLRLVLCHLNTIEKQKTTTKYIPFKRRRIVGKCGVLFGTIIISVLVNIYLIQPGWEQ